MKTQPIASPLTRVYNQSGHDGSVNMHVHTMLCPACGRQEGPREVVRIKRVQGMPWQEWHCGCNGEPFQAKYVPEPEPLPTMNYNPNGKA